jgi:hypothetical protein
VGSLARIPAYFISGLFCSDEVLAPTSIVMNLAVSNWDVRTILRTELGGNEPVRAHRVVGGVRFNQSWVKGKL